jgi:plastocyanin
MRTLGLLGGCLATVVACSSDKATGSEQESGATVVASADARFSPSAVTVPLGGTVTWRFEATPHNVMFRVASGAPGDIPGSNANTSVARTFGVAGSYGYDCTLHPGMSGTVTVARETNPPPGGGTGGYP